MLNQDPAASPVKSIAHHPTSQSSIPLTTRNLLTAVILSHFSFGSWVMALSWIPSMFPPWENAWQQTSIISHWILTAQADLSTSGPCYVCQLTPGFLEQCFAETSFQVGIMFPSSDLSMLTFPKGHHWQWAIITNNIIYLLASVHTHSVCPFCTPLLVCTSRPECLCYICDFVPYCVLQTLCSVLTLYRACRSIQCFCRTTCSSLVDLHPFFHT